MIPVDGDFILEVAPRFSGDKAQRQREIVGAISGQLSLILESYEISTYLRIAHFMGQVTHECAGFQTTEEFASGAAYNGRADLGNTKTGDGPRYKGRGLLQLTGRFNYRRYGDLLNLPLEDNPLMAGEPLVSLKIACEYWKDRKINPDCDRDDLIAVTKKVNGGLNGLADRREYYRQAKIALSRRQGLFVANDEGTGAPVIQRGSFGDAVTLLQEKLRAKGYNVTIDADFGPATDLAVRQFQTQHGLTVDGVVGAQTWKMLG
jgi:putative chitinase